MSYKECPKLCSAVASVTQQSRQRVPQSRTEYRERPKATCVQTVRLADDQRRSIDDVSVVGHYMLSVYYLYHYYHQHGL